MDKQLTEMLELTTQHKQIMDDKNIIICVYTNASGFLWSICKVDCGTDLGWCDFNGDSEWGSSFTTYNAALYDAITLINMCDLEQFRHEIPVNKFHWGNYSTHLNEIYRPKCKSLNYLGKR
jgi:hypothetical protein